MIPMECAQAAGILGDLDTLDIALCDHLIMLGPGKWPATRRIVPTITRDPTRLSACPLAVHFGCGDASVLHDTIVFEGLLIGLLDDEFSRGHSFIAVCRRYHILHSGLRDCRSYPITDDGCIHRLFWPSAESSQIHDHGLWTLK